MYYFIMALAVIFLAFQFVGNKTYQTKSGNTIYSGISFNVWSGLFSALIFLVYNKFQIHVTLFSVLMSLAVTLSVVAYTLIGFKVMEKGSFSTYTVFLMVGGMLMPYIYGLVFLSEKISAQRMLGICLMIISIILSVKKGNKKTGSQALIILYIAVFLLNGCTSIFSKIHQIGTFGIFSNLTFENVATADFMIIGGILKVLISSLVMIFLSKPEKKAGSQAKIIAIIFFTTIFGGISYFLQLVSASNLPATVLYPFITGGNVVICALAGLLIFKEKLSGRQITGIVLCFAATLLFL